MKTQRSEINKELQIEHMFAIIDMRLNPRGATTRWRVDGGLLYPESL